MGIISSQNNFLFIHIPKTGGISLKNVLEAYGENLNNVNGLGTYLVKNYPDYYFDKGSFAHAPAHHIKAFLGDSNWDKLFKFAVIRNPWERMVSAYSYMHQTPNNKRHKIIQYMSFSDFIRIFCEKLPYGVSHLFTDETNSVILDNIYRLEDLPVHISQILTLCGIDETIPIPHLNKSKNQDYRTYYSNTDAERVAKACRLEILIGDYKF